MKTTTILGGLGGLALLASATMALQFASVPQSNIIAKRLEGKWRVDSELTAKLDPAPGVTTPREVEFTADAGILKKLGAAYPRYLNFEVYVSGIAKMNGESHWFIVMNEQGNNHLVLFTPSREVPADSPHHTHINMVVSRNTEKDLLFLGGDMARESAVAYGRFVK